MVKDARGSTLRILLDTNIVIAHEDDSIEKPHINADGAAALIRTARDLSFELLVSSGTRRDFLQAKPEHAAGRQRALNKYYHQLDAVPENSQVRAQFPADLTASNRADLEVLSTFAAGVATALVTEDTKMRDRASRAGLQDVFSLDEAIGWITALQRPTLDNAVSARMAHTYQINRDAPLFESLRDDYDHFSDWWHKVVDERRDAIILGDPDYPTGLAVLKAEADEFGLGDKILKVCTFKVEESVERSRRGELLLRAVVDYASKRLFSVAYMTVKPHHEKLLRWLLRFGFYRHATTHSGEHVMAKSFAPQASDKTLAPLDHQIRYGPQSILVDRAFVVPIQAEYHKRLFPDSEQQISLFDNEACGNAIRKAYLCHSNTRQLAAGDTLLFLRTEPETEALVTAVGVVEETLASTEPNEVATFVAGRTVYSYDEICARCEHGEVLAVLFRLDRRVVPAWRKTALISGQVMASSPQSIASVPEIGVEWVREQLSSR